MIVGCTSYSIANRVLVLTEAVSSRAYRAKVNLNTLRIVLGRCAALGACPVSVELLIFLLVVRQGFRVPLEHYHRLE